MTCTSRGCSAPRRSWQPTGTGWQGTAELRSNHNPAFAPVIHPTLEAGLQTILIAAATWLAPPPDRDSE